MDSKVVGMESDNARVLRRAHELLDELALAAFQPGRFGTFTVEIRVEDGDAMTVRQLTTATEK